MHSESKTKQLIDYSISNVVTIAIWDSFQENLIKYAIFIFSSCNGDSAANGQDIDAYNYAINYGIPTGGANGNSKVISLSWLINQRHFRNHSVIYKNSTQVDDSCSKVNSNERFWFDLFIIIDNHYRIYEWFFETFFK